uniref:Putative homing endonuclease n=1 Tax=viral metagenome TaxID=1070528 RepID=A0A6H1ZXB2_9ZZZZ
MTKNNIDRTKQMVLRNYKLNKREITEAIYWIILGDGCIEKALRGNYRLAVSHKSSHEDYLLWKASIIDQVTSWSVNPQNGSGYSPDKSEYLRLRSSAHPWFTRAYDRIYAPLNRKSIDPHALKLLSPLGLSILYQDDGSYHYSLDAGHNILIHKLCFSKFELEALAKTIVDKFGIIFRVNRVKNKGLGYRLRMRASDKEKFFDLIDSYIVPSMLYKVGKGSTSSEVVI